MFSNGSFSCMGYGNYINELLVVNLAWFEHSFRLPRIGKGYYKVSYMGGSTVDGLT